MTNIVEFSRDKRDQAMEEASLWMARIAGGEMSEADKADLSAWLRKQSVNKEALRTMAELWSESDCLQLLAEVFPVESVKPRARWSMPVLRPAFSVLACIVVLGLLAGVWYQSNNLRVLDTPFFSGLSSSEEVPSSVEATYRTEMGEQTNALLEDQSTMSLNTNTRAVVQYDEQLRQVFLQSGEAHFTVTKDPDRPFLVHAGKGTVRAIGTAFNVKVVGDEVEVLVTEGVVEIAASPLSDEPTAVVTLEANDSLVYGQRINASYSLPQETVAKEVAWTSGQWSFKGESLSEVIAEIARYSEQKVVLSEPAIGDLRVGGYFDIGDVEPMMETLALSFGLTLEQRVDGTLVLSR